MENTVITEFEVEKLLATFGVMFVNRGYGKATTKTVTLDCLTKVINKAIVDK